MLIDPALAKDLAAVRRDLHTARMLPSAAYHDADWFASEKATLFGRNWIMAGRAEQIEETGAYFTINIAGECVLIVRGQDDQIRAFSPSCRHRGAMIAEDQGRVRAFVCPYHRWTYGLDGRLIGAPEMTNRADFDRSEYSLAPIHCAQWQGFIFVNLATRPAPLDEQLHDLLQYLQPYNLSTMRLARERRYVLQCNWKAYMDNSVEAYHVASVHGRSLEPVAPMSTWRQEVHEGYYLLWSDFAGTLGVLQGEKGFPPMPGFSLDRPERHLLATLLPNTVLTATIDAIWWVTIYPMEPEKTMVSVNHAFPAEAHALPDYDTIAERYFRRFDIVNIEDNEIVERQHRGLMQSRRRPGPYAPQEELVHAFSRYVADAVAPPAGFPANEAGQRLAQ